MNPTINMNIKNVGVLKFELFLDTPISTGNFCHLIKKDFYNGLKFHRIIKGFVAQGGCPDNTGMGGPGYKIDGEFTSNNFNNPHSHKKGALAFARSMARNSAGSQFYIALDDIEFLDKDYAVFGMLTDGFEHLKTLEAAGSESGTPTIDFVIKSISLDENNCKIPKLIKIV